MKFNKNINRIALLGLSVFILNACKKIATTDPIGDAGSTYVHLLGGGDAPSVGSSLLGVDFVNRPQTIDVADIRRDAANSTDLNIVFTATVKDDTAAIRAYNTANGTSYVNLPRSWYTVNFPATSMGGTYTLPFAAGEFAKQISITIPNATLLDPSTTYALAFTLVSNSGGFKNAMGKTFVFAIGAKNQYDGVYTDAFCNYHPSSNPGYSCSTTVVHMITTGANKVKIFWPDAVAFANPSVLGGALSYFGAQEPEYTVNTVTNEVTVQNAAAGAVTFYTMNSSFNSRYDPATRTFYVKFGYNNPGGIFNAATTREWTQTLKYTGPR